MARPAGARAREPARRVRAPAARGAAEDALRIAIAFARALPWDAHAHEVRGWLQQALVAAPARAERAARRRAVLGRAARALAGALRGRRGARCARRWTLARALGRPALEAAALTALGRRAVLIADPSAAERCARPPSTVARRVGDPGLLADALLALAGACERAQDWERAAALADEALALYREAGDPYGVAAALGEQGFYDMVHGRLERSEQRLGEALELRRQLGDDRRLVEPLIDNAWLDLARGERRGGPARVPRLPRARPPRRRPVQRRRGARRALRAAALDGDHADAVRLAGASAAIHERIGAPPWESLSAIHERALDPARQRARRDGLRGLRRRGPAAVRPTRRRRSRALATAARDAPIAR